LLVPRLTPSARLVRRLETGWFSSRVYSSAMGKNLCRTIGRHVVPDQFVSKEERARNPALMESAPKLQTPYPELAQDIIRLKRKGRHIRLKDFDNIITSKIGGLGKDDGGVFPFKDADDYYRNASSKVFIQHIRRPLLAINAFDDPIIHGCEWSDDRDDSITERQNANHLLVGPPQAALPVDEVTQSSYVMMAVTAHGGHLGWFDGPLFARTKKVQSRETDGTIRVERVRARPQQRWIAKPVREFISAIVDELDPKTFGSQRRLDIEHREKGWHWVKGSEVDVYGPVAWREEETGGKIQGNNESGVLAGL
jgi:predicted alpha/beta-fold hydrolase